MGPDVGHDIVFVVEERTCMDRYKDKIERVVHVVAQKWYLFFSPIKSLKIRLINQI